MTNVCIQDLSFFAIEGMKLKTNPIENVLKQINLKRVSTSINILIHNMSQLHYIRQLKLK